MSQPIPHLAFPFTIGEDGTAEVVEQDSLDEVAQCVQVLLSTPQGSRVVVPSYGVPDPTFVGLDEATVEQAVSDWEPRAEVAVSIGQPPANAVSVTVAVATQGDA